MGVEKYDACRGLRSKGENIPYMVYMDNGD